MKIRLRVHFTSSVARIQRKSTFFCGAWAYHSGEVGVLCVQCDGLGSMYLATINIGKWKLIMRVSPSTNQKSYSTVGDRRPQIVTKVDILIINTHCQGLEMWWEKAGIQNESIVWAHTVHSIPTVLLSDISSFKTIIVGVHQEWLIFCLKWPSISYFKLSNILLRVKKRMKSSWCLIEGQTSIYCSH